MENLPLHSSDFNNNYDLVKLEAHFVISFRNLYYASSAIHFES